MDLETIRPEAKTNPRVYYKNLYRFTHCFIAGSVAVKKSGLDECAAGAKIRLLDRADHEISSATPMRTAISSSIVWNRKAACIRWSLPWKGIRKRS